MAKENNGSNGGFQLPFEKPVIQLQKQIEDLEQEQKLQSESGRDYAANIRQLRAHRISLLRKIYQNLTPWETVQVARHPDRPLGRYYLDTIVKNFMELHGDRFFADDKAIICGFGTISTEKVAMIVQHKGNDTKEKIACNFGCAHPEGYRKALRVMKLAEKFKLPIVSLIDTQGAYPGVGSEERGVAEAIARNLLEMSRLKTPVVCVVIGEGGSGGALGIAVGDRIAMLAHAYYSVISPEGCASILWRTGEKAPEAAEALKLTSKHLKELGVIDDIIPEPLGGAHRDPVQVANNLEQYVLTTIRELKRVPGEKLLAERYTHWRKMGKVASQDPVNQPACR